MTVLKFPPRGKEWREGKRWLLGTRDPSTGNPPPTWVEQWYRKPDWVNGDQPYPVFIGWDFGKEDSKRPTP